jgi:hypothetical protein
VFRNPDSLTGFGHCDIKQSQQTQHSQKGCRLKLFYLGKLVVIEECKHQFHVAKELAIPFDSTVDESAVGLQIRDLCEELESLSRPGNIGKLAMTDFGQDDSLSEITELAYQQPPSLGHSLNHNGRWQAGVARTVLVDRFFRQADAFHCPGIFATDKFGKSIDPKPAHSLPRLDPAFPSRQYLTSSPSLKHHHNSPAGEFPRLEKAAPQSNLTELPD